MLMRRKPSATYSDRFGPTVLALLFIAVLIYGLVTAIRRPLAVTPININGRVLSRFESMALPCTLAVNLWNPPEDKFRPAGITYHDDHLYISDEDGRVGVLDPRTLHYTSYTKLGLPPVGPIPLGGIAFGGSPTDSDAFLYATRINPPGILEINTSSWTVVRSISLRSPGVSSLAMIPARNISEGFFAVNGGKGTLWNTKIPSQAEAETDMVETQQLALPGVAQTLTTPLLNYHENQLFISQDNVTLVYSTGENVALLRSYSLAVPDLRGLAFAPSTSGSSDVYALTGNAKIINFRFNAERGFEFCA